ncbi:MAG: O-antigen ligase domain-containing protein [Nevskiaceae bacterium]|nr:MAG: O-antigen ligase domain-containing protein [Nevskiaceae bacterium]
MITHLTAPLFHKPPHWPSSPSLWLFAAALFMSPLSGVRPFPEASYGDILFGLSCAAAIVERLYEREMVYVFWGYLLAAALVTASYVANLIEPEHMGAYEYMQFIDISLKNHLQVVFDQAPNFRVIFISAIIFPQAFLLLRARSFDELRTLVLIWTAGACYGAIFAVLNCWGWLGDYDDHFWTTIHRASGLTAHPNAMALSTVLAFPGLLLLFLEAQNLVLRASAVLLALVAWQAIGYSGSRTAVYTLAFMSVIGLGLMIGDVPRHQRLRLAAGVALVLLIGVLARYWSGPSAEYSAIWRLENGSATSDTLRATNQEIAKAGFLNAPVFGQGYQWLRVAHNMYLQMLHSAGLVGFLGFILAMGFPLYMTWRTREEHQAPERRRFRNCLLVGALGVLVWGWAQPNINALNPTIPFGLLLYLGAMTVANGRVTVPNAEPLEPAASLRA